MKPSLEPNKNSHFTSLNDILKSQLNTITKGRFSSSLTIQEKWLQIVGKMIAAHSQVLYIKNGSLYIGVDNSTWHNELTLMKDQIIGQIRQILPDLSIKEVRFKIRSVS